MLGPCVTVVDIGSGSMKASVFEKQDSYVKVVGEVSKESSMFVKPGENLSGKKLQNMIAFLSQAQALAQKNHCASLIVVATQFARNIPNFQDFQKEVFERTGIEIRTIHGAEEAEFAAKGVKRASKAEKFLAFDIGAGSVEIAEFDKVLLKTWSLSISVLELSRAGSFQAAESKIEAELQSVKLQSKNATLLPLFGYGGVVSIARKLMNKDKKKEMTDVEVQSLFDVLCKQTRVERRRIGVPEARIDSLPYGLLMILKLMKHVEARRFQFVEENLRTSLAYEFFNL